ncbi:MAG: sugar transferase [Bacteroidota bacterium]
MKLSAERTATFFIDAVAINLAWVLYYYIRVRSGWISVTIQPTLLAPMAFIYLFWVVLFFMVGLYRPWYAASRFDEIALLFKTTAMGCVFLFFVIFVDDAGRATGPSSRVLILLYWLVLFVMVSGGRVVLRSTQRRLLVAGIGARKTIILGSATRSRELFEEVRRYPALGYRVVGFVGIDKRWGKKHDQSVPLLGYLVDLAAIIRRRQIQDIIVALDSTDHDRLLDIVARCSAYNVGLKIVPDLYDIISGMAKTNQIYGFPLIEISPQLLKPWEEATKRFLDVAVSATVLVAGLPLWLLVALAIKLDSSGSVFYKQERVGKDGDRFRILKFRSMHQHAEREGPKWAHRRDPRVTRVGRVMRKLHLDEVPQMFNVLRGQMSLIGPRPERPVIVEQLSKEIPMYPRRLKVRPGITGWAQVKHKYDESIDDVKKKVQYDLFYIENISLRMDVKILFSTVYHMLLGKGH